LKLKNIMFGIFVLFIIVITSVIGFAQPPQHSSSPNAEPQEFSDFLILETNRISRHPINNYFYAHLHPYYASNGLIVNTSELSCDYHLYSENILWEHLSVGDLEPYGASMFARINESYFNETGLYSIMMWCECETCEPPHNDIGGFTQYMFEVYDDNEINQFKVWSCPTSYNGLYLILGLAVLLIILSLVLRESIFGVLGGFIIFFSYFYIGACAPLLTGFLLVAGILITLFFAT
jgi:hypothetical protein